MDTSRWLSFKKKSSNRLRNYVVEGDPLDTAGQIENVATIVENM